MSKTLFLLLGADRVGKTTAIKHIKEILKDCDTYHFSGPSPEHNSPIDQYTIPLSKSFINNHKYILCDRGGCEVCFYEKYRRGIDIDISWAHSFESWCLSNFSDVYIILVKKDWGPLMRRRHLDEIEETWENCSAWFKKAQLMAREKEHQAYYEYMDKYFNVSNPERSLIPQENIIYLNNNQDFDLKYLLQRLGVV